jgi:hypothetical protein
VASKRKSNPVSYKSAQPAPATRGQPRRFIIEKIVSGGQTGVDRAALDFAREHGIAHGGWCPRGRLAEDGAINTSYELKETPDADYPQRTEWNVRDSDATVIFTISPELTGGSALTRDLAVENGKPWLHLSQAREGDAATTKLGDFIQRYEVKVLNVAGPRLSAEPAARAFASQVLEELYRAGAEEAAGFD